MLAEIAKLTHGQSFERVEEVVCPAFSEGDNAVEIKIVTTRCGIRYVDQLEGIGACVEGVKSVPVCACCRCGK